MSKAANSVSPQISRVEAAWRAEAERRYTERRAAGMEDNAVGAGAPARAWELQALADREQAEAAQDARAIRAAERRHRAARAALLGQTRASAIAKSVATRKANREAAERARKAGEDAAWRAEAERRYAEQVEVGMADRAWLDAPARIWEAQALDDLRGTTVIQSQVAARRRLDAARAVLTSPGAQDATISVPTQNAPPAAAVPAAPPKRRGRPPDGQAAMPQAERSRKARRAREREDDEALGLLLDLALLLAPTEAAAARFAHAGHELVKLRLALRRRRLPEQRVDELAARINSVSERNPGPARRLDR